MHRQLSNRRPNNILERRLEHVILHFIRVHPPSVLGSLMTDLHSRLSPARRSGISHQLGLDAPIHSAEDEDGTVHGLGNGQNPVVLKNDGFLGADGIRDPATFFGGENDAAEVVVDGVVVVKSAVVSLDVLS